MSDSQPIPVPVSPTYVEPRRPRWRRDVALVVILAVVGGLILSILVQPWDSPQTEPSAIPPSPLIWIGQVIVSFIVILAALAELSGWNVRELFSVRPAGPSAEVFPFHVIRDFDELLVCLFPDPTKPLLPDRSIPFLPRIAGELDAAFRQHGRVLIRGRSKTGKTREAVELLRRWWHTGPTVLLAKNRVSSRPPFRVPDPLPIRNLVLFFDDVDRYCGDADAVRRLDRTIAFFANLCHEQGELRVVATARQESGFWDKLLYDESVPPWAGFELLSLPALSPDGTRQLIERLARVCRVGLYLPVAKAMAARNDGTFLNPVLSFRSWLHEGITQVGPEHAEAFVGDLAATWRRHYERLVNALPEVGPIYAAVDMLQTLDVPLRQALVVDLATEMSVSRVYHLLEGLFCVVEQRLALSPWLDWYRDPRRRRRWLAVGGAVALLALYVLFYVLFCVASINFQVDFFTALVQKFWLQLLVVSPLLIPLVPLAISLALHWHRHRKQRRVRTVLDCLLATEVPLWEDELRPYEGQFEGNGTSRAWPPSFFAGQERSVAFKRLAAPRLAMIYWTWAEKLRDDGELEPARSLVRLAGVLAPHHPTPPFALGRLWYDERNFGRALAEFTRSRALNPSATAALALERSAWCFYQLGKFDRAESVAGQALALMPALSSALWVQGLAQLRQGWIESGLVDCRQAALTKEMPPPDLSPALTAALNNAGSRGWAVQVTRLLQRESLPGEKRKTLWHKVRWDLAVGLVLAVALTFLLGVPYVLRNLKENTGFTLRLMDVLVKLYPRAPTLLTGRGIACADLGDYEQAIADYTAAVRLDPNDALAYINRGTAYDDLGDYERAIADYTEAIRLDPNDALAHINRGYAYRHLGNYERAIADYTEAIRLDPDSAVAYNNRGIAYNGLGNYEWAIADYTEAIFLNPDFAAAYHRRAIVYRHLGDYERAIADYTEAIRLDSNSAAAYHNRGIAYNGLGDYERAIADYTEAIRLNPDFAAAYHKRAIVYTHLGDYERAITDYTEVIRLAPDSAWPYVSRGRAYNRLGNDERAIADYTDAIRLDPNDALAYINRGYAYEAQGNLAAARADWERAIELFEAQDALDTAEQVRHLLFTLEN